jgi:hypothetical protein
MALISTNKDMFIGHDFRLGDWPVHVIDGPPEMLDDVVYISFAGDFGFRHGYGFPSEAVIAEHINYEKMLLSNFHLNIINFEFVLPCIGGQGKTWEHEFETFQKCRMDVLNNTYKGVNCDGKYPVRWYFYLEKLMLNILQQSNFHVVSFANNHILDYGSQSVFYNQERLSEIDVAVLGTKDKPYYEASKGNMKIGIFGMTDYIDKEDTRDLILKVDSKTLFRLKEHIKSFDFAAAFVHLISRSVYPGSYELEQVDHLVETGFNLIVCTGSHWVKGFTYHKGTPVIFGIGNHLFSYEDRFTDPFGIYFVVGLHGGRIVQLFVIPYNNSVKKGLIGPVSDRDFGNFLKLFKDRSELSEEKFFRDERTLYELKRSLYGYGFLPTKVSFKKFESIKKLNVIYFWRTLLNNLPGLAGYLVDKYFNSALIIIFLLLIIAGIIYVIVGVFLP